MKLLVPALVLMAALTGCARHTYNSPNASPGSPSIHTRAGCEHEGGTWNAVSERCEIPY